MTNISFFLFASYLQNSKLKKYLLIQCFLKNSFFCKLKKLTFWPFYSQLNEFISLIIYTQACRKIRLYSIKLYSQNTWSNKCVPSTRSWIQNCIPGGKLNDIIFPSLYKLPGGCGKMSSAPSRNIIIRELITKLPPSNSSNVKRPTRHLML